MWPSCPLPWHQAALSLPLLCRTSWESCSHKHLELQRFKAFYYSTSHFIAFIVVLKPLFSFPLFSNIPVQPQWPGHWHDAVFWGLFPIIPIAPATPKTFPGSAQAPGICLWTFLLFLSALHPSWIMDCLTTSACSTVIPPIWSISLLFTPYFYAFWHFIYFPALFIYFPGIFQPYFPALPFFWARFDAAFFTSL